MTDAVQVAWITGAVAIVTGPQLWGFLTARRLAKENLAKTVSVKEAVDGRFSELRDQNRELIIALLKLTKEAGVAEGVKSEQDKK